MPVLLLTAPALIAGLSVAQVARRYPRIAGAPAAPAAATLGPSFPSGHSATAAAFYAAAAPLLGRRRLRPTRALAGLAVGIAGSRLLDVHWLSDVISGLALGWAWFAVCGIAFGGRILRFGAGVEVAALSARSGRPFDAR